jgi:pimeloyl-[acyl-carrier protein] methyl ester esterase
VSGAIHVDKRAEASANSDAGSSAVAPSGHDAIPLVMLHGWGMNLRVFDPLRAALSARPTWAIDLPGHGRSEWNSAHAGFDAQVDAVLAVLPPRCVLLGWSLGAKFALEIAGRVPQRIAALVLVSATPKFAQNADWPHGLEKTSMDVFRSLMQQDWQQTLSDFVSLQLRGSRNAEAARRTLEQALAGHGAPQPSALQSGMDLLGDLDLRARVAGITQPTLVIAGENDRVTPPGAARWLTETLPNCRLLEIARAGHAPFASHPEECAAGVHAFLAGLPAEFA